MTRNSRGSASSGPSNRLVVLGLCAGLCLTASTAMADQPSAEAAISRADGRIDMAGRQAGGGADQGGDTYAMARQRLQVARDALHDGRDERAEMLANEASLLADLTVEKAKLTALITSHDLVATTAGVSPQPQ